jgi:hypothetical protein
VLAIDDMAYSQQPAILLELLSELRAYMEEMERPHVTASFTFSLLQLDTNILF